MSIGYIASSWAEGTSGTPPTAVAVGAATSIGNVIVVGVQTNANDQTAQISDTLNGAYIPLNAQWDSSNSICLTLFYIQVVTAGTPTISVSGTTGAGHIMCAAFNGFVGKAAVADVLGTSSGPKGNVENTVANTSFYINTTSGQNNELMIGFEWQAAGTPSVPSGWSNPNSQTILNMFYAVEASSGTNNTFTAVTNNNGLNDAITAGIFDLSGQIAARQGFLASASPPSGTVLLAPALTGSYLVACVEGNFIFPTLSDSLNGSWTQLEQLADSTNNYSATWFGVQNASRGNPSFTVGGTGGNYVTLGVIEVIGFAGTATFDRGWISATGQSGTTASLSGTAGFADELILLAPYGAMGFGGVPSGWLYPANLPNNGNINLYDQFQAAAGAWSFSIAVNNGAWDVSAVGIYDKQAVATAAYFGNAGTTLRFPATGGLRW